MPAFSVADEQGRVVTNNDMTGKKTVIYFYPKDSTPGCTAEACNIRDNYHAFLALVPPRHATYATTTMRFWRKAIRCTA